MKSLLAGLALTALAALPAAAQNASTHHGFALGLHLVGATVDPEDGSDEQGGGGGLVLRYGFRNGLSIFLQGDGARMEAEEEGMDDYDLGVGELGLRYTFRGTAARLRPFVDGALGAISAQVAYDDPDLGEVDAEISGPVFTIGGGVDYYLGPKLALGVGLRWSTGSIDEIKVENVTVELEEEDQFDLRATRLQVGLQYFFARN